MKKITGLAVLILLLVKTMFAQSNLEQLPLPCGGYKIDTAAMIKARSMASQNPNQRLTKTPYLIRIYIHICTLDDGTSPAATLSQINSEFNTLNSDYAPFNICFLLAGIDYVNNTTLNTTFNVNTGNFALYDPYKVPGCINIFYQKKILGNNSSCPNGCGIGGYAFFIPSNACLVSSDNIGKGQTISHEIGHCLGLFHTFESFGGYETINGSNSFIAGDMITDTPADPYAWFSTNNPCFSQSNGVYTGNCVDPNFQSNYSPPYYNLMAYWWSPGSYSPLVITQGQYNLMNTVLTNILYPDLLACKSPDNFVDGPGVNVTSGYHEVSAIFNLSTSGSVFLGGTSKSTLGGTLVLLEPGFHADANSGASILIKPANCLYVQKRVSEPIVNQSLKNTNAFDFKCYPNPFSRMTTIQYDLAINGKVDVAIYNTGMQMVAHPLNRSEQSKGNHQVVFNAENLPSGIYLCKLETQGKVFTIKMILIR